MHREPAFDQVARHALLDHRRDVGRGGEALRGADADRAQRAALQVLLDRRQRQRADVDLPADEVGQHRAHALVRNVRRLDAGLVDEHLRGEMQDRAVARRAVVVARPAWPSAARSAPARSSPAPWRIDHDHDRRRADDRDRRDVGDRVERHRLVDAGIDHVVVRHDARASCRRAASDERRVPTMPPAPGWFSTTTGWPSAFDSAGCAARVIVSTPEAVATGRMNLTARSPICACDAPARRARRRRAASARCASMPARCGVPRECVGHRVSPCGASRVVRTSGDRLPARTARRSRPARSRAPPSSSRVCSPIVGGSRRTPSRWPSQRDRKQRRLHRLPGLVAVGQAHVGEAAGRREVRVVVQVLGPADRRERQADALRTARRARRRCVRPAARAASRAARAGPRTRWLLVASAGRPSGRRSRARRRTSPTAHR